jgi:hypothetical protein
MPWVTRGVTSSRGRAAGRSAYCGLQLTTILRPGRPDSGSAGWWRAVWLEEVERRRSAPLAGRARLRGMRYPCSAAACGSAAWGKGKRGIFSVWRLNSLGRRLGPASVPTASRPRSACDVVGCAREGELGCFACFPPGCKDGDLPQGRLTRLICLAIYVLWRCIPL